LTELSQQRKVRRLVLPLLNWYDRSARALPWRRTRDPYAIWVAEIMLQQTQVKTVIPFWERWMKALPTIAALASASSEKIHKLWEGLGYYTRVRNLQRAAAIIQERHGGKFPEDIQEMLELPGIGRYTAGAISSIAFNQAQPILDGNVIRVLARVFGIGENVRQKETRSRLWKIAEALVCAAARRSRGKKPEKDACSRLNQSLMELGALVCTPKGPQCFICPVRTQCAARRSGEVERFPVNDLPVATTQRRFVAFVAEHDGRLLVRQRPRGVVNGRLWEFPNREVTTSDPDLTALAREATGLGSLTPNPWFSLKHSITRYRIQLDVFRVQRIDTALPPKAMGMWLTRRQLKTRAFASAHGKILERIEHRKTPNFKLQTPGNIQKASSNNQVSFNGQQLKFES